MNKKTAFQILNIDENSEINEDLIKKKYRMMVLKYHPDKNRDESAIEMFHKVQDAFEYLNQNRRSEEYCESETEDQNTDYESVLQHFLHQIFEDDFHKHVIFILLSKILKKTSCKMADLSVEFLKNVDKSILKRIYDFLKYYSDIFPYSLNFLEKIREIIEIPPKTNSLEDSLMEPVRIILHPLLEDLFENNLYKLTHNHHVILVPLWHHELVYDLSGKEFYVECFPILEENIRIDEVNNIHVHLERELLEIWEKKKIEFKLGKTIFSIPNENIIMSDFQTLVLKKKGISRINQDEIYSILEKGDIFVYLTILHKSKRENE